MRLTTAIIATLFLTFLTACGGGGGDDGGAQNPPENPPTNPPPTGGIGRSGIALGPISTFGSIVVNGVRYETDSATFTIDDMPGTQDDLRVGQVVTVKGTIDDDGMGTTGSADEVIFDENVEGPVESVDVAGSQLVVLGQTVLVRPETSFDDSFSPASPEGVNPGQIVGVSGQIDADGNIVATRIEPKPAASQYEVRGTVNGLDTANLRFNINSLVIDYSSATLDDFPSGQISEGDFVEAKGSSLGAGGELLATQVELESFLPGGNEGDRIEIEGFVTRFASAQDFDVAGQPVTTTSNTAFEGGAATDLALNVKLEAEGDIDANGVLVATKIDIRRAKAVRLTANTDSVDAANNSLVVLGITIEVDGLTRFEDKSDADVDPLTLADISAGDYLEIRGGEFPAGSGTILATILEREDPDTEAILQGFVESTSEPSFEILGVTVNTNGSTVFRDVNDNVISATDFFDQVAINDLVKVQGSEASDTTITATEVEFELEF